MKDLGEASFVLGIKIHQDRSLGVLGLSQEAYTEKVLKKFNIHKCRPSHAPIVKGDKYGNINVPRASLSAIACKPFHTLQVSEAYSMLKYAHAQTWLL